MITFDTKVRDRYGETDRMGYVYYGTYALYFEVGRVEALRSLGFPYREIEEQGVLLPVHDMHVKYHRPARYDDVLTIRTTIRTSPSVRIVFDHQVLDAQGAVLTEAAITLVFVDRVSGRPRAAMKELVEALSPYFR
jgi:acyl-CoA thioester hydrolase